MTPTQLRRLPLPVAPAPNETIESYLHRLANTNHLAVEDLRFHLGLLPTVWAHAMTVSSIHKLSNLTGYAEPALVRALPELDQRHQNQIFQDKPMTACSRCVRRHPGGLVIRYFPHHVRACPKHRLWFGGHHIMRKQLPQTFLDISKVPIVLAAQRRYRRLVHRRGVTEAHRALVIAHRTWDHDKHLYPFSTPAKILETLRPDQRGVPTDDLAYKAAIYPGLIKITSLLTSPYWQHLAADPKTRQTFFTEAGHRLHDRWDYTPATTNPLHQWAEAQTPHPIS